MLYSHSRILKKYKRDLLLFKLDNLGLESKTFNNIKHLITLIEYGFDDEKIIQLMKNYHSCTISDLKSTSNKILIYLYGKELGEKLAKERCMKKSKSGKRTYKNGRKPAFRHFFKEYWLEKGYTEAEAIEIVNKRKNKAKIESIKAAKNRKSYKTNVNIDYYLNKGMTLEEATKALKKRQNTVSLKSFQRKYGEKEGLKRYNERNKKWQTTLNNKSDEEKERIYKLKVEGFAKAHRNKISNEETFILNLLEKHFNIKIERQFEINYNNKTYLFDGKYDNILIEFNGDYWHCNPLFYKSNYYHEIRESTANEIWNYDDFKCNVVGSHYRKFIIWENELNDTDKIIERFKIYLQRN